MNTEYFVIETSYCNYYVEIWHQYPDIAHIMYPVWNIHSETMKKHFCI